MSSCGPMIGRSSEVKRRVSRSSSAGERLARLAAHAALRAAVGKAQERALPRHPHRERGALAERHLRVVADAALRRADACSSAGRGSPGRRRAARRPSAPGSRRSSSAPDSAGARRCRPESPRSGQPGRTARPPFGTAAYPTRAGHGQARLAGSPRPAESSLPLRDLSPDRPRARGGRESPMHARASVGRSRTAARSTATLVTPPSRR